MANLNTAAFGLIAAGTIGSTPATQGQGKYYIETAYATSIYQGTSVLMKAGYVNNGQAVVTEKSIGIFNGCFYNAATTLKPTWSNHWVALTAPANSENAQAFVIDNTQQLYVGVGAAALTQANIGKSCGLTVVVAAATTGGSTLSGQSDCFLLTGAMHATANQWRVVRTAEDPSNNDIASVNASYVVCHNLNQYANGLTWQ